MSYNFETLCTRCGKNYGEHYGEDCFPFTDSRTDTFSPEVEEKPRTRVQQLADALATLESARAYFHRSTYTSDGASPTGTHLTWTQWYNNTSDSIVLLSNAITVLKLTLVHELSSNI